MIIDFSVIFAFSSLFIASIFDVKSLKGDVPEIILYTGIASGLVLHIIYSLINSTFTPILYSLVTGLLLGAYGYFAYRKGMWGGADFLGLVILGVSTPYFLGVMGTLDLIVNVMMVGFLYAAGFGFYRGLKSSTARKDFISRLKDSRKVVFGGLLGSAAFSIFAYSQGLNGLLYFLSFSFMILLYYFMMSVEENLLVQKVDASEVEVGDVLAEGEIRGVEEEDLEELEGEVKLKEGIRFMPVFPVGLMLTVYGISFLELLIQVF